MKDLFTLEPVCEVLGVAWDPAPGFVSPAGHVLEKLPDAAATSLGELDEDALPGLAGLWSETDGTDPDDALWVLRRLRALARLAVSSGRPVLLYVEA